MQCENCTRVAEYQIQQYRFCLPCARKFLGYTPGDEQKIHAVSLPTQAEQATAPMEETRASIPIHALGSGAIGILEQEIVRLQSDLAEAERQLDELRTTLEQQSQAKAASDAAANRLRATIWAALEQGTFAECRRVLREGVE